jgi:uncharacterized membrane protein YbhN (UPF0104 family)
MQWKTYLRPAAAMLAMAVFLFFGQDYLKELDRIGSAWWPAVLGIAIVHTLTLWLQGLTTKWGLDAFDRSITATESFSIFVLSSYANLLLPRSGLGATAAYLHKVKKCSLVDYGSVVLVNGILFVMACSGVCCILLIIGWLSHGVATPIWLTIGVSLFFVLSVIASVARWGFFGRYKGPGHSLITRLNHATCRLANSGSRRMFGLGAAHIALAFLRAIRFQFAFLALGLDVPFFGVLFASVLGDLAFVIAFTPSALGFREAAVALSAAHLGIPVSLALSAAVLDRLVFSLTVVAISQIVLALGIGQAEVGSTKPGSMESSS